MTSKKQVLKPDIVLKNYWSSNAEFADLFNAVLFSGKQIIQPEELAEVDTEESSVFEHRDYVESVKSSRDNIKVQKKATACGVQLVMLGLESQEYIHYAMPMRVMGYDYATYKKQYEDNAKTYQNHQKPFPMEEDEYLSRMKKTDKFIPVITIVVYYGEKAWNGAKSLHEILQIPEGMTKYINDYKMHLVEARKNNLALHCRNNLDLFNLLQIVLDQSIPRKEAKQKAIAYSEEHKIDKLVVMTLAGAANVKIDYNALEKGGNMCTLFEEERLEGKIEGKLEGKLEGRADGIIDMCLELGLSEDDILEKLQVKLNISKQVAKEYLEMYEKQMV